MFARRFLGLIPNITSRYLGLMDRIFILCLICLYSSSTGSDLCETALSQMNVSCLYFYNFSLHCVYKLPEVYENSKSILGTVCLGRKNGNELYMCENATGEYTQLNIDPDSNLVLNVAIRDGHCDVTEVYPISPMDIYVPQKLRQVLLDNVTSTSVTVSWSSSNTFRDCLYHVTCRASWGDVTHAETRELKEILVDLTPYTTWTISVRQHVIDNNTLRGTWSDDRVNTTTTLKDIPATVHVAPGVTRVSDTQVIIHWQPLTRKFQRGNMEGYSIRCKSRGGTFWNKMERKEASSLTLTYEAQNVECHVTAVNDVGMSAPSRVYITASNSLKDLKVPKFWVVRAKDSNNLTFEWKEAPVENSMCTVYTCAKYSRGKTCQIPLQWRSLPCSQQNVQLEIPGIDEAKPMLGMSVEVVQDGHVRSTDIRWTFCLHFRDAEPKAPSGFRLSSNQPVHGLHVEWNLPDCKNVTAYLTGYVVSFCKVGSNGNCQGHRERRNVSNDATNHVIEDLDKGITYKVWIQSHSGSRISPRSSAVKQEVSGGTSLFWLIISVGVGTVVAVIIVGFHLFRRIKICLAKREPIELAAMNGDLTAEDYPMTFLSQSEIQGHTGHPETPSSRSQVSVPVGRAEPYPWDDSEDSDSSGPRYSVVAVCE